MSQAVIGIHCKCGNISETVQDRVVVTTVKWYISYQVAATPMILSDHQGHYELWPCHLPLQAFFKRDFSYSCAAIDKASTGIACRAVPLRWPSFLLRYASGQTDKQTYIHADHNTSALYRRRSNNHELRYHTYKRY